MSLAFPNYRTVVFRMNWAMGVVFVAIFVAVVLFVLWLLARLGIWRLRAKHAEHEAHQARHRPDGQPYPPAGAGICDHCGRAHDKVYFMPSGRRFCPDCYASLHMAPGPPWPGSAADRPE